MVQGQVVAHERDDEGSVYPRLAEVLRDSHGLSAMSRAHREILHLGAPARAAWSRICRRRKSTAI